MVVKKGLKEEEVLTDEHLSEEFDPDALFQGLDATEE